MIVVYTPTIDDYVEVVQYGLDIGKNWLLPTADDRLLISNWHIYNFKTCVRIGKFIEYSSIEYFISVKSDILDMDEFIKLYKCRDLSKIFK